MSQQQTTSSLLSLSIAAASAQPIPLPGQSAKHHRRLSSTGKTRRRLSDARDAANRPTPATAAALSLASLSLSSSPPSTHHISASLGSASDALVSGPTTQGSIPQTLKLESSDNATDSTSLSSNAATPIPIANGKNRKRGVDHKCESCSKIYRHPSCLIKHRWEHTPHWREASKYVLSKHQQVQLLEAAAILSHLSPSSSLPEDRSLWPSYLSGGSLPPPENPNLTTYTHVSTSLNSGYNIVSPVHSPIASQHTSSSVPILGTDYLRASSYPINGAGPRLHDYDLPVSNSGVAQLRPGLVGIPNANANGIVTPTPAGLAMSVPTRISVPPLMEEDEDSKRDKFSSPAEDSLPRSRSASVSTSGEEDDEMSTEKPWRSFVGRRYSDDGVEEHGEWRGFGKDEKRKTRVTEWDGIDMEMEMD